MYGFRSVVIADASPTVRELLPLLLGTHGAELLVAADASEAMEAVNRARGPTLLIADMELPPEGGVALFERCVSRGNERPAMLALTSAPSLDEETRVTLLGAIGHLPKPVSYRGIAHAVRGRQGDFQRAAPRVRAHPLLVAEVCDDAKQVQLWWDVLNLSVSGAFLATRAPLPIGVMLMLRLALPPQPALVAAEVVRLQSPSWAHCEGVGVAFRGASAEAHAAVEGFVRGRLAPRA